MILLRYVLNNPVALNRFAPEFTGIFPFVVMFIVAAVTTPRERARGTLERLMAMQLGKLDLLLGYAIALGLVACTQVDADPGRPHQAGADQVPHPRGGRRRAGEPAAQHAGPA